MSERNNLHSIPVFASQTAVTIDAFGKVRMVIRRVLSAEQLCA